MVNPQYEHYILSVSRQLYILGVDLDNVGSADDNQLNAFSFPVTLESILAYWSVNRYIQCLWPDGVSELPVSRMWNTGGEKYKMSEVLISSCWIPESRRLSPESSPTFVMGTVPFTLNLSAEVEINYWIERKHSYARTDYQRAVRIHTDNADDPVLVGVVNIPTYLTGEERIARLSPFHKMECELKELEF